MRKLVLGVLIGFLVAATAALAYDVTFPSRLRVQAHALVDELGNVLLGSTPAKIEVTNLPAYDAGEPKSVAVYLSTGTSANVLIVPADKRFILTDVAIANSSGGVMHILADSTGARLFIPSVYSVVNSYRSGIAFSPGETITLSREDGGTLDIIATFIGRLEPVS